MWDNESQRSLLENFKSLRFITPPIRALAEATLDDQNTAPNQSVPSTVDKTNSERFYRHFSAGKTGDGGSHISETATILPQELINAIIEYLHDDLDTLRICSVVHSTWVSACRDHIFASVAFHMLLDLEIWVDSFPFVEESPTRHVRSLHIAGLWAADLDDDFDPDQLEESLLKHFQSFNHVRNLSLMAFKMPPPPSLHHLDHFRLSLKSLKLYTPSRTTPSRLLHFILSFPHLEDLVLSGIEGWLEEQASDMDLLSSLQVYPPFLGNLKLINLTDSSGEFLNLLLNVPTTINFRAIDIDFPWSEDLCFKPINGLFASCASTLETLKLGQSLSSIPAGITIEHNTALRHLSLTLVAWKPFSCTWLNQLLSNINSPNMSTVNLRFRFSAQSSISRQFKVNDWDTLDRILVDSISCGVLRQVSVHVLTEPGHGTRQEPLEMIQSVL